MMLLTISWKYLIKRPLDTLLNMLLLGMGVAIVTALLVVSKQMNAKTDANLSGIDAVVGAKGSPLQLVLSSVFHADLPTGNIPLASAEKLAANPTVKRAIPLALGDRYLSFRIIGTNDQYLDLYQAQIAQGSMWTTDFEVVIGADVAEVLAIGQRFHGSHGLGADTGEQHDHHQYRVVGLLKRSGTVLDQLILTNIPGIWAMHDSHGHDHEHEHEHPLDSVQIGKGLGLPMRAGKEITAVLLQYKSKQFAMTMPRMINQNSNLMAAAPTPEITRLYEFMGSGKAAITAFAYFMIGTALLGMFTSLYKALSERQYDLALIRAMGASRFQALSLLILESTYTALGAWLMGMGIAHGGLALYLSRSQDLSKLISTGWVFYPQEWLIGGAALAIGLLAAALPAIASYRTDVSEILAKR